MRAWWTNVACDCNAWVQFLNERFQVTFPYGSAGKLCQTLPNPSELSAAIHNSEKRLTFLHLHLLVTLVERPAGQPQCLHDLRYGPLLRVEHLLELASFKSPHRLPTLRVDL